MSYYKGINQTRPEPKKRYFVLNFICLECGIESRLGELERDFIERFHCPDCGKYGFLVKKKAITKTEAKKNKVLGTVVMEERRLQ